MFSLISHKGWAKNVSLIIIAITLSTINYVLTIFWHIYTICNQQLEDIDVFE